MKMLKYLVGLTLQQTELLGTLASSFMKNEF